MRMCAATHCRSVRGGSTAVDPPRLHVCTLYCCADSRCSCVAICSCCPAITCCCDVICCCCCETRPLSSATCCAISTRCSTSCCADVVLASASCCARLRRTVDAQPGSAAQRSSSCSHTSGAELACSTHRAVKGCQHCAKASHVVIGHMIRHAHICGRRCAVFGHVAAE